MKKISVLCLFMVVLVSGSLCFCQAQTYKAVTKDNEVSDINVVIVEETNVTEQKRELSLNKINIEITGLIVQRNSLDTQIIYLELLKAIVEIEAEKVILIDSNLIEEEIPL